MALRRFYISENTTGASFLPFLLLFPPLTVSDLVSPLLSSSVALPSFLVFFTSLVYPPLRPLHFPSLLSRPPPRLIPLHHTPSPSSILLAPFSPPLPLPTPSAPKPKKKSNRVLKTDIHPASHGSGSGYGSAASGSSVGGSSRPGTPGSLGGGGGGVPLPGLGLGGQGGETSRGTGGTGGTEFERVPTRLVMELGAEA